MFQAQFRFYAELNDLLPLAQQRQDFSYEFTGCPTVKDAIEALGVPHTEVDLILVNGISVGFDHRLAHGDRVAVYPVFESLDISPIVRLESGQELIGLSTHPLSSPDSGQEFTDQPTLPLSSPDSGQRARPLRRPAFVLDVHLGKLARLMRMLGLDTLYRNDYRDDEIVHIAVCERRIVLTRDRGLLKRQAVTRGYWVRSTVPLAQAREVVDRFDLHALVNPFTRCIRCNGAIVPVDAADVRSQIPPQTASWCDTYYRCAGCGQVYWQGTHYERMQETVARILSRDDDP